MNMIKILVLSFALAVTGFGQIALTQTTVTTAVSSSDTSIVVASATGITAYRTWFYVVDPGQMRGELMQVASGYTAGQLRVPVIRGARGQQVGHVNGAVVIVAPAAEAYRDFNPLGACTAGTTGYTPQINSITGEKWICSTSTLSWVPAIGNDATPPGTTATVASTAGLITPSGRLFTVSGTAAITGFTAPPAFTNSGSFCVIPSGIFTTTAANNISLASTAVVGKLLCWTYNAATSKWVPSY